MPKLIQTLWDQMRADLGTGMAPQIREAYRAFLSGKLGPLTEHQTEDLESIARSFVKLERRFQGEQINWEDYSEAAHALRGPLNSTIGFSRLMLKGLEGPITEAQNEALQTIYDNSRKMLALFNLLLDVLLMIRDGMAFTFQPVRVDEVFEEIISVGEALTDNRDFSFETDLDTSAAEIMLQSDKKRLQQALLALLAVSSKYMSGNLLTLRVQPSQSELLIELESRGCQLQTPLPVDLSHLLADEADSALPYDVHLRLGLAWRLLTDLGGRLETHQTDQACSFVVTLPIS